MADDDRSARQIARQRQRNAGDRSTRLASSLMKLTEPALRKVELDDEVREAVDRARAVTSHIARRRAERALAGDLRRFDLVEIEEQLAAASTSDAADARHFHAAEQWRTRLIEGGIGAAAELPGGAAEPLPRLVEAAQRERATGRPPGAARALFRHIVERLKAKPAGRAG